MQNPFPIDGGRHENVTVKSLAEKPNLEILFAKPEDWFPERVLTYVIIEYHILLWDNMEKLI